MHTGPAWHFNYLTKLLSALDRRGCFSFLSALASICRSVLAHSDRTALSFVMRETGAPATQSIAGGGPC
jgi:hypothetical protein